MTKHRCELIQITKVGLKFAATVDDRIEECKHRGHKGDIS